MVWQHCIAYTGDSESSQPQQIAAKGVYQAELLWISRICFGEGATRFDQLQATLQFYSKVRHTGLLTHTLIKNSNKNCVTVRSIIVIRIWQNQAKLTNQADNKQLCHHCDHPKLPWDFVTPLWSGWHLYAMSYMNTKFTPSIHYQTIGMPCIIRDIILSSLA